MDATCFHLAHRSIFLTSQVDTLKDVSAKLSQSFCIVLAQAGVEAGSSHQVDPVLLSSLSEETQVSSDNMLIIKFSK